MCSEIQNLSGEHWVRKEIKVTSQINTPTYTPDGLSGGWVSNALEQLGDIRRRLASDSWENVTPIQNGFENKHNDTNTSRYSVALKYGINVLQGLPSFFVKVL